MLDVEQVNARLKPGMTALKHELSLLQAPAEIEAQLLKAFVQQHPPLSWWRKMMAEPWQWSGVLAMGLLVTLVVLLQSGMGGMLTMNEMTSTSDPVELLSKLDAHEEIPFVALDSGEAILKQDNMRIVQAQIPLAMLASLGVPVSPQAVGEYSTAEMLVGDNDEYLALRFIPSE